jgi:restriction system protein
MKKDTLLKLLDDFYSYFKTGYDFEEFLKYYLSYIGLDEVVVTQRSRDGGVDLTAIRKGIGEFSEVDTTKYYIQAKRNKYTNSVGSPVVLQLKGRIPFGHKGILITTSKFTKDAVKEASNDPSKPVVLIDGLQLISSCIDNQIGFVYKPSFSSRELDQFIGKNKKSTRVTGNTSSIDLSSYVEKEITSNDIRARIISIPSIIINAIPKDKNNSKLIINEKNTYEVSINRSRNYIGSVTKVFKDFDLISIDGVITPKKAKWKYDEVENKIYMYIIEE